VAFAEVENFLDTAVKHYSSGMVHAAGIFGGAHLEPEILIVDEVLAVGDITFQRKCLNKMQDKAITAAQACLSRTTCIGGKASNRAIWLDGGSIASTRAPDVVGLPEREANLSTERVWEETKRPAMNNQALKNPGI